MKTNNMRILIGVFDTRRNHEDFAITPYLSRVWVNDSKIKVFGIGICWGYYGAHISIGINVPKYFPTFKIN